MSSLGGWNFSRFLETTVFALPIRQIETIASSRPAGFSLHLSEKRAAAASSWIKKSNTGPEIWFWRKFEY